MAPGAGAVSLSITLDLGSGFSPSQVSAIHAARDAWQSWLYDYQPAVLEAGPRPNPVVTVQTFTDALGGVLAQAGPTEAISQGGFVLATEGIMLFDTADLPGLESSGTFYDVVLHELAHVLGFGTLWVDNGLYLTAGQYTGTHALNAWRTEFNQPDATFVPVETTGGAGTAHAHWDEVHGGALDTGITQTGTGLDMRFELMTGWLNAPTFVSATTLESFRDLGFAPVPEPAEVAMVLAGICLGFGLVRGAGRGRWKRFSAVSR